MTDLLKNINIGIGGGSSSSRYNEDVLRNQLAQEAKYRMPLIPEPVGSLYGGMLGSFGGNYIRPNSLGFGLPGVTGLPNRLTDSSIDTLAGPSNAYTANPYAFNPFTGQFTGLGADLLSGGADLNFLSSNANQNFINQPMGRFGGTTPDEAIGTAMNAPTSYGGDFLGGLTPGQASAQAYLTGQIGTTPAGFTPTLNFIDDLRNKYLRGYQDRDSYTTAMLSEEYPELYDRAENITPGTLRGTLDTLGNRFDRVAADRVGERNVTAANMLPLISQFQDPYNQQVLSGALRAFDENALEAENVRRAALGGRGIGAGREDVLMARREADTADRRARLAADILSQGFTTGAGLAGTQAGLLQQAELTGESLGQASSLANQDAALKAALANQATGVQTGMFDIGNQMKSGMFDIGNRMTADQYNQDALRAMKQFDVGAAYQGDKQRMSATEMALQNLLARSNLGLQTAGLGLNQAQALFGMGTSQFSQPYDLLRLAPYFSGEYTRGFGQEFGEENTSGFAKGKNFNYDVGFGSGSRAGFPGS